MPPLRDAASRQLALPFDARLPPDVRVSSDDDVVAAIASTVARHVGVRVEVELTENRRTMISMRRVDDALRLRLHRMFVEADAAMVESLGRYVKSGDRRASRRLGDFIESKRDRFVGPRPDRELFATGRHYDLAEIFGAHERTFFPGACGGVGITWGRHGGAHGRRRKRSIRLGTYTEDERLIRVHPALDQAWVPRYFVEYIVFHEMLHHVEPAREESGRTVFHTDAFRARERAYPDYHRALAWERQNLGKLLAS
jgi:hypothetical protein